MNIPLPTDNLYKFMALFGLTLIITGCFFIYKQFSFVAEYQLDHIKKYSPLVYKLNSVQSEIKELQEEYNKNLELSKNEAELWKKQLPYEVNCVGPVIIIGIIISIWGFILWYFKLQRYQDMIVKKEAGRKQKKGK